MELSPVSFISPVEAHIFQTPQPRFVIQAFVLYICTQSQDDSDDTIIASGYFLKLVKASL